MLLIGVGAGLWMGVNIGKDKPILSNPFVDKTMGEKIQSSLEDVSDSIDDSFDGSFKDVVNDGLDGVSSGIDTIKEKMDK